MIGTRSNAPVEYISQDDAALDTESSEYNFAEYLKTFDRKYLPCKPGVTPTVFTLRRLSRKHFTAIAGMPKHQQAEESIARGVVNISGFALPNGNSLVPEFDGSGADQRLSATTLDAIFSPKLFAELSQVVIVLSELDPLAGKRSA